MIDHCIDYYTFEDSVIQALCIRIFMRLKHSVNNLLKRER